MGEVRVSSKNPQQCLLSVLDVLALLRIHPRARHVQAYNAMVLFPQRIRKNTLWYTYHAHRRAWTALKTPVVTWAASWAQVYNVTLRVVCSDRGMSEQRRSRALRVLGMGPGMSVCVAQGLARAETVWLSRLLKTLRASGYLGVRGACVQFVVPRSRYRVDLWLPASRVVVECDEHHHRHPSYDADREADRERFIKQTLKCTFVRFDPYESDFDFSFLVQQVVRAARPAPAAPRTSPPVGAGCASRGVVSPPGQRE